MNKPWFNILLQFVVAVRKWSQFLEYLRVMTLICCLNARILWPTLDKGNHQTYLQANKHHFQQPTYKIQANILVIISISFFVNP